ncbi:hypothetical protein ACFQH1_09600 [Lactiplantibacillus daoliensis]|uniref:LPXTG cell wall anchor domain-containing protein n=1 Tax=Lactiplantibacillus daoliensis TaxID=2559916 RepID=A0ABW1UHZ5_9LACO|nr:hypothetical protein [Lactiplantibacillus daoliensis]
MKKIMIPLTILGLAVSGYWLWRRRKSLRNQTVESHRPPVNEKVDTNVADHANEDLQGSLLADRDEVKDWVIAVKCNVNK